MSRFSRYPDFFIVGAQRSGTTSLCEALRQHPQIFMSPHKETHFFSQDRVCMDSDKSVRSENKYLKLFARAASDQLTGEASPSYLWHDDAAQRIYRKQPEAKIIAILREPVARAFSQYQMDLADGLPPLPFYDLITREFQHGEKVYGTGHLYVELGLYAEQVKHYQRVFGSERVLILSFHAFSQNPRAIMAQLAKFLEIAPQAFERVDVETVHNRNIAPRSSFAAQILQYHNLRQVYRRLTPLPLRRQVRKMIFVPKPISPPDPAAIQFLQAIYTADLEKLAALCGICFPPLNPIWV